MKFFRWSDLAAGAWIGVALCVGFGITPRGSLIWAAAVTAVAFWRGQR